MTKVEQSAQRLVGIINDILDISKIESEHFSLEQADFALGDVLETLNNLTAPSAREKGLALNIDVDPELGRLQLHGDSLRLGQILINLTANAIKFTAEGSVAIRVLAIERAPPDVRLRFEVRDTGIGISADDQERVFRSFEQADGSMTRKYGGTGLGLAICKRLARAMKGDIGIESQLGAGSTFWFTVTLKAGAQAIAKQPAARRDAETLLQQRYRGKRILVADDEPVNLEVTRTQLEDAGLAIDTANDGEQALDMARTTAYAAILMDMQMPRLNGLEATRRIRELAGYGATPIIAMTANAYAEDKAACQEAGMDDFLTKPFDPDTLFATVLHALESRSA